MEPLNQDDVLPRPSEMPPHTLGFIMAHTLGFKFLEDLSKLEDLSMELNSKCAHLETHLQILHRRLGNLLVTWSSRSIRAKTSLQDFILNLENVSLTSSQYGNRTQDGRKIQKIVAKDLPFIAEELRRVESLRQYAEVALKLETLVGDLEDAVLSALNQRTGYVFSRTDPSQSIPGDFSTKLDNVHRAVKAISSIEELLLGLLEVHPQWRNLLKVVDARVDKILGVLRPQVIADHRNLLASLGWPPKLLTSKMENREEALGFPNPLVLMQGGEKQSYSQSFLALCALQHEQSRREERQLLDRKKEENLGLWAIDELVFPIASRIEHHLLKWTDQPEFMFALVYKITHDFIQGVDDILQPLIDRARLVNCSAKEAWVSSMVKVISGFLAKGVFPNLAEKYRDKSTKSEAISSWLHLIDHILRFDKLMQSLINSETYMFSGEPWTDPIFTRSISVLTLFCDRPDWLQIWAKAELKDAWKKLKVELKDEKAWLTDKRHGEDHKAPIVSEFALKLTREMIQRSKFLPGTSHRIRFIRSSAAKFLWHFLKVLHSRHETTEFPAYDSEQTLIRICQLINAARFTEFKLREWSDEVEFLELNIESKGDSSNNSCFFDEEIESIIEMETNWVMEIISHILHQFENLSFDYIQNMDRFELAISYPDQGAGIDRDMTISDDLAEALDNLRNQLFLIKENLNANDFLDTWRSVADGLDRYIFGSILSIGVRFSDSGVKQFIADMGGLFLVFQAFCDRPEAFFPCIRDFMKLLKLGKEEVEDLKCNLENAKGSDYCFLSHRISNLSVDHAVMILNNRTFLV